VAEGIRVKKAIRPRGSTGARPGPQVVLP